MKLFTLSCACSLALVCATSVLLADDWPQWRGPHRDGISRETGLLQSWPESGPPLLWQAKAMGDGYSTPAVVGDHLYLISSEGKDSEHVLALSAADGERVWSAPLGAVGRPDQRPNYPTSRSTPTVDGDRVYVLGSDGDLACLAVADGKVRWKKNLLRDFGGESGTWAYSESPLIDGRALVCAPGGATSTVVALDKMTGEVIWKTATPEGGPAGYASAIVHEIGGVRQYLEFLGKGLVGLEAASGKVLWRYTRTADGSPANIPTPVVRGALVYSGASRTGGGLIRVEPAADGFVTEEVYFSNKLPTAIGGAVLVGDHLYGAASQSLLCVEFATGKIQWEERSVAPGSLCYADGRLVLHGESGTVALLEPTAEGYREHGRFTPPDQPDRGQSKAWAYPVIANGRLYLRDMGSVWCYDIRAK